MKRHAAPAIAFCFPFLYFFRFVYPNTSFLVVKNDFEFVYYAYKAYLADSVAHGHFPLWSPAEAGGYGFFGNPFAAALYPLNVLPIAARLLFGNYNYWFHQIFTVAGVSIFGLGLFRWLHQTFHRPLAATFTAITLTACWSMGEFMRFPNAIHAIAWVPWVLSAMLSAHRSARLAPVYAGMAALFCELTAGYPYFVVYSFFLYGAYALYLHWSYAHDDWKASAVRQVFLLVTPVLVTFPYTYAISQLMKVTSDRGGADFAYTTDRYGPFGPLDLLGSLVFPPVASVEGCFYAGILTVFLLVLYFWRSNDTREKVAVMVALVGFLAVILNHRSYVFTPIWSFVPVVNQMRVFSRMTIILLPLLAIAVHQGLGIFFDELAKRPEERRLSGRSTLLVFAAIFGVQGYLYSIKDGFNHDYLALQAAHFPAGWREIDFLMYTVVTAVIVLFVLGVDWTKLRRGPEVALTLLALVVTLDAGSQGRLLWTEPLPEVLRENGVDTSHGFRRAAWELAKQKANYWHLVADYFELDRLSDAPAMLASEGLRRIPTQSFDYAAYTRFYDAASASVDQLNQLMGKQKLYFHETPHDDLAGFLSDANAFAGAADPPAIEHFDGNELRFEVTNHRAGYLSWIDNFDAGWSAEVDGAKVPIERVLGTFKSLKLDRVGTHHVRFVYRPIISAGAYMVSIAGLGSLALMTLWSRVRHRRRRSEPTPLPGAA
jgi:hypothetical protein